MDAISLTAIVRELREDLVGGRIQEVVQPDADSLAMEVYAQRTRQWLLIDVDSHNACVYQLPQKARRGVEVDSPFLLLARKTLIGARLQEIHQPAWERILSISFHHPEHGNHVLVAEIMGRWSNLVLVDDGGYILEALHRFGSGQNPYRTILPGKMYVPPPPQRHKRPIDLITIADLRRLIHQTPAKEEMWRVLVREIMGMSPLLAREMVFRATGDTGAGIAHPNLAEETLMDVLVGMRSLAAAGGWAPSVALDAGSAEVLAFAPYQLTHLGDWQAVATISQAAHRFYESVKGADSYAGRRQGVQALLDSARQKLLAKQAALGEQATSSEDVENLRVQGEWILTYAWQVKPGDTQLLAETGEETLSIPLDPSLSAIENAQAYFARYRKAQKAFARVPQLLADVDRDLMYLDQLQTDLNLADNAPQIEELREALIEAGLISAGTRRPAHSLPRAKPQRLRSGDGFGIWLGRNARQNDLVTWQLAQPDDLWLHVQGFPGAHVIIKSEGRQIPEGTLEQAASWAAWHSQAREDGKVVVMVTRRRHLRKFKGARPGQVRVLHYDTVTVAPAPPPKT